MHFSLTAFPFYILRYNFLKYRHLKPWCFSFSALGHHVTPLPMLSPLISTHCLQHCTYAVAGVQNIMTHLAYDHINDSFFIPSYSKTEIMGLMQGHLDQYPETQLVKTSHGSVPAYSSLVTCVLKTVFFLTFLYCIQCPGSLPLATTPTQYSQTNGFPQSRILLLCLQPIVWKPEPCPTTLMLNLQTQPQNGAFYEKRVCLLFKTTTVPPTLPASWSVQ
jgi:hypothetical protein